MKKTILFCLFAAGCGAVLAQDLPVRSVTLFKNNRALLQKSGAVQLTDERYSFKELPDALFGTFWVNSADGSLQSVFSVVDSVATPSDALYIPDILKKNLNKPLRLYLNSGSPNGWETVEGVCEKVLGNPRSNSSYVYVFRTNAGRWLSVTDYQVVRVEFVNAPDLAQTIKIPQPRLDLRFRPGARQSDVSLSYLTGNIGWTPIYRLELRGKNKGHLALRAEVANDAEDLGDTELRLAVGVPNFAYAQRPDMLFNFDRGDIERYINNNDNDLNPYRGNIFQTNASQEFGVFDMGNVGGEPAAAPVGSQAEDFYFYSIRPGNFPKHSRYQYPIFETDVEPKHFYECVLKPGSSDSYSAYKQQSSALTEAKHPVFHFIEFKNTTAFPWTTGVVNLLSENPNGMQPLSQDMLPYTAPGGTCKVRIAQTPEIKVTHAEGDVDRQENAKKFFSTTYDRVKIEAQVVVVNYGDEPVTLKVLRDLEGNPLGSPEVKWDARQEQATLRVNPSYTLEWVVELKPGQERKWTYTYEVFVNM